MKISCLNQLFNTGNYQKYLLFSINEDRNLYTFLQKERKKQFCHSDDILPRGLGDGNIYLPEEE